MADRPPDAVQSVVLPVILPGAGKVALLEHLKSDPNFPNEVFQRVAEGEELRHIAGERGLPKGAFVQWYMTQHEDLYNSALKVWADGLAHEALKISDAEGLVDWDNFEALDPQVQLELLAKISQLVQRDRLRVDTRFRLAGKWDRQRYGETVKVERSVTIGVDAGLLGRAGDLLKLVSERGRVIEAERGDGG